MDEKAERILKEIMEKEVQQGIQQPVMEEQALANKLEKILDSYSSIDADDLLAALNAVVEKN